MTVVGDDLTRSAYTFYNTVQQLIDDYCAEINE